MTEFLREIEARLAAARRSLEDATAEHDDYLIQVRTGEIESLQRLLAEHGGQDTIDLAPTTQAILLPDSSPERAAS